MALAAYTDIETWLGKTFDAGRQAEVTNCISFAQAWIAHQAALRSLEKEATAVTEYFDGSELTNPTDLWLPASCRPVWHSSPDFVTVTENGQSVSVAVGYSQTAGVVLQGANSFERVRLVRSGGWAWSASLASNIAVTAKCGFDTSTTASVNPLPMDVKRLVMEVAMNVLNSPNRAAKSSQSKAGSSVTFKEDLSAAAIDTLDWLRGI